MLDDFVSKILANNEKVGDTPENFGECVGLVEVWFDTLLDPHVWGNAKDLYANAGEGYTKGDIWPAPEGAAVVFDSSWGGGVGHTAISFGDGRVFEQNNPLGHLPRVSQFGPSAPTGYIGYILPDNFKDKSVSTLVDVTIAAQLSNLMSLREGPAQTDPEYLKSVVGKPVEVVIPALMKSDERRQFVTRYLDGQRAIEALNEMKAAPLDNYSLGDLLSAAFKKTFKIK